MFYKIKNLPFFLAITFSIFIAESSCANVSLIRDAETEKFLHELADPIFVAANLDPNNIHMYIVNDDSINAFVSGGQNVFINTGLIRKYNAPDALIGVIAHETGHIVGGHVARSSEQMQNAGNAMLLSYLLGIGAAIAGSPDAAQAIILGGNQVAEKLYMKYSRGQEEAADQYAVKFLNVIHYPASGLLNLLQFFQDEMVGYSGQIDEYAMSHPISQKRVDFLRSNMKQKFSDQEINSRLQPRMNMILAKLEGFIEDPDELLKKYKNNNDDMANYVKAIALHRKGENVKSLQLLDLVMRKNVNDGFLYEVKAQILFESGEVSDSIIACNKAMELLGARDSSQVKIAFALAILTLPNHDLQLVNLAISRLKEAQKFEDDNPFLYKQLANAYNQSGDEGRSYAALAQYNFLVGEKKKARKYAKLAKEKLEKNASKSELTRLDDLIESLKDEKDDKKDQ